MYKEKGGTFWVFLDPVLWVGGGGGSGNQDDNNKQREWRSQGLEAVAFGDFIGTVTFGVCNCLC